MSMTRRHSSWNAAFAFLIVLGPATFIASACKKDEPPPPVNLPSDEDDKPKKKKKSTEDEDPVPIDPTAGGDGADAGKPGVGGVGGVGKKTDGGTDNGKALLQACCTALHNAAAAAGVAKTAGSAIPGLPPAPPEDELKKQAAACDKAVVEFSGDLNKSLKTIKGASPIALPAACNIG
jgi:hypothetical protein